MQDNNRVVVTPMTTITLGETILQHSPRPNQHTDLSNDKVQRLGSLAGPRHWHRQRPDEILHVYNARKEVNLVDAMDWLFNQGIVFDILPDDKSIKRIATSDEKIQILACLTYLEYEPEQENIPLWSALLSLLAGAGGFAVAKLFSSELAYALGAFGLAVLLVFILLVSKKNYHSRQIAAWANSWITAIKEYSATEPEEKDSQPMT